MSYVAKVDYPDNFGNKYQNLVASGQRPRDRVYFQHPANSGQWYELFYDVLLVSYNAGAPKNPFNYEFVYWVTRVRLTSRGNSSIPLGETKYLQDSFRVSTNPLAGGYQLDKIVVGSSTYTDILPTQSAFMRNTAGDVSQPFGYSAVQPRPNSPITQADQTSPSDFKWKPRTRTATGTPGQGDGGGPYWGTRTSKPDDPKPETAPSTPTVYQEDRVDDEGQYTKPKKRTLRTNPPMIATATGAYVGVNVDGQFDQTEPSTRNDFLGSGTQWQRRMRKGLIRQYIVREEDWQVSGPGSVTTKINKKGKKTTESWSDGDSILNNQYMYGFRFHYNPATISFGVVDSQDVDINVMAAGIDKSMPMVPGASISLSLYLNRIEDMSLLRKANSNKVGSWRSLYSGRTLSQEDIDGILQRGTGWDLEFLFRAGLGRAWQTALRGPTADLGVMFGVPLLLNLGGKFRFPGRVTNLSYQHMTFTQDMVPMFTQVNFTFSRHPDSAGFLEPGGQS